jgi:hypothetical protein
MLEDEVVEIVEDLSLSFGERLHVAPLLEADNVVGGTKSERNAQESTKQKAKVNWGLNLPASRTVQVEEKTRKRRDGRAIARPR